ncbi:MAG: hypothetical protein M1324_04610 [Patescibacteria group bacterium]|nr:hypothetical protein [Patescibacteria group bacterium]
MLNNADSSPCYRANNSILKTKKLDTVGKFAESIIVLTDQVGDKYGSMPEYGVLIAKSAGEQVGGRETTTVLVEKNISFSSGNGCYIYDQKTGSYQHTFTSAVGTISDKVKAINNINEYQDFTETVTYGNNRLEIITNPDQFSDSITEGLKTGILVLRKTPRANIGKGMGQAVVIIEDLDTTPEEARTRISQENRSGGVILMRLPDPTEDEPNNTKLIDLEDDWLEAPLDSNKT